MLENHKYDELLKKMKEKLESGLTKEQILTELHKQKVSIIDAIKVTKDLFADSLTQAREILTDNPVWQQITYEYEEFHQKMFNDMLDNFPIKHEIENALEEEEKK